MLAHVLGNILLGMAIGLVGYSYATDLLAQSQQSTLAEEFPAEPAVEATTSVEPTAPPEPPSPFDWEGWVAEDVAYWRGIEVGEPFGRLTSEEMDLDAVVVKGHTRAPLMKGPGYITYTDYPGPKGNFGVAGHRTTYGAPFRHIDRLSKGDEIVFTSPFRVYTYRVTKVFTVTPDRVDVMDSTTKKSLLTMTACHPPYSARLRLIARSELVSVRRLGSRSLIR